MNKYAAQPRKGASARLCLSFFSSLTSYNNVILKTWVISTRALDAKQPPLPQIKPAC